MRKVKNKPDPIILNCKTKTWIPIEVVIAGQHESKCKECWAAIWRAKTIPADKRMPIQKIWNYREPHFAHCLYKKKFTPKNS